MKPSLRALCAVVLVLLFSQTGRAQTTAQFTFPTNGATGIDLSQPMTWTTVTPVDKYYLYVGTAVGLKDLVDTGEIVTTSAMAYDVPTGQTIYARLWTKASGVWTYVDITFVASASTSARASMTFPANGVTNADLTQPIQWSTLAAAQSYTLWVGTAAGTSNLINSGETQLTSYSGSNLPGNQTLYVRLWTKVGGVWRYRDTTFSATPRVPTITFPAANATNVDLNQPIQWTTVPNAQSYYLWVGTTPGASDVLNTGSTAATSFYAYDAPLGVTLYARAWAQVGGVWRYAPDVPFSATATTTGRAVLTYPATNGATNVVTTQPLTWTSVVGAEQYYLYIGTAVGLKDFVDTGGIQATSYLASNLPSNQTVYVRLWTKSGYWRYVDSTFTTACVNVVTPTTIAAAAAGSGAGTVTVSTVSSCGWTATSDAAWVTPSVGSGTGSGTVGYAIAANVGAARTATLTIAGQTVSVSQAAGCTYFVTPSPVHVGSASHSGYVAVTTSGPLCPTVSPTTPASWLTLGATSDDFVERVLAEGPIGYWAFHETLGATTAPDYTGHGLTGVLVGGAAVTHLGYVDLDGVSGRVAVPASPLLTMTHALTAEMWLTTTHPHARVIGASNDAWELDVGDTGVLELRLLGQVLHGYLAVTDDVEHFVDATWDGTTASLYIDGALDAQMTIAGTLPTSAGGLLMGGHPTRGDYFAGQLGVVVVFDQALSAAQVADRFVWEDGDQSPTSAVLSYSVDTNWAESPRTATITVAPGQQVSVIQAASQCSYVLTPTAIAADAVGQTGWAAVTTAGSGCLTWTPTSSESWLTLGTPIVDQWAGYVQRVLADAPVAYWTFDDANGGATTVQDLTGHGLTATLVGGAIVPAGHSSLTLDGTTGHAVVGSSARLTLTHALSVELWFGTEGEQGRLVGANNDAWALELVTGGYVELRLLGQALRSATAVNDGGQHKVNATWNGTVAMLYLDGSLDAQMALPGTLPSSTAGITMGAHPTTGAYYTGLLDDVAVFDYVLTAAQVLDRFQWDNGEQSPTSGVFSYTVAANPTGSSRVAALAVADRTTVVTQAPAPPVITSATPASGAAGSQVTITGSALGFDQGTATLWLGTKPGTVVTWSDTQIVASVATGSLPGTVQVRRSDSSSNSVSFTVLTPSITSVTVSGDGTTVTVTGSGFGGAQGAGQLWLGTAAGTVTSWTNTQIVATVAPGSNTGNVQVLQNGTWGNALPFTPANLSPHIDSVTPSNGPTGTAVTVYGSGFGASQGSSAVVISGVSASVSAWSDSLVSMTVPTGAVSGVLKIQRNGTWSNTKTFVVPSATAQVTLVPNVVSLVVGETRRIQSLNPQGAPLTGLTWASSDPAIVSLSADDPPVLTAVAGGTVTLTAGSASADVTVYAASMPSDAVLWSDPGNASGVSAIHVAVPSDTGVADVFAVQADGSVQAITSDGTVAWTASVPAPSPAPNSFTADFAGGLVVFTGDLQSIYSLDGLTGQPRPPFTATSHESIAIGLGAPAVHPDGTIFTIDYACKDDCSGDYDGVEGAWIVGVNPATGVETFRVPTINSTKTTMVNDLAFCAPGQNAIETFAFHAWPSTFRIAGDGFAYLSYTSQDVQTVKRRSGAQHYSDAAYDAWDALWRDLGSSSQTANFAAAIDDAHALFAAMGVSPDTNGIVSWLQQGNRALAVQWTLAIGQVAFRRPCDVTTSEVTALHVLRVGSDGAFSDIVVKSWSLLPSVKRFVPVTTYPFFKLTTTVTGPASVSFANGEPASIITNADRGVLASWQAGIGCSEGHLPFTDQAGIRYEVVQTDSSCTSRTESHLTTTANSAIASDISWEPGGPDGGLVQPVIQLEDDSFAGKVHDGAGDALLVFDGSGLIKWTLPGYTPIMATAGGGLIARADSGNYAFDAAGNAIGQVPKMPIQSWMANTYQFGSIARTASVPSIPSGVSFWAQTDGNASHTGAGVYKTAQFAAMAGLNFISPLSQSTGWEWGGLVCQQAQGFLWSRLVTDENRSTVHVLDRTSCAPHGTAVADYHAHPPTEGTVPSGGDIQNANLHPELTFYLIAPKPDGRFPPSSTHVFRYRSNLPTPTACGECAGDPRSAAQHTFEFINGAWRSYVWP